MLTPQVAERLGWEEIINKAKTPEDINALAEKIMKHKREQWYSGFAQGERIGKDRGYENLQSELRNLLGVPEKDHTH